MCVRFDVLMAPLPQATLFKSLTFDPKQWKPRECKKLHNNADSVVIIMSRNNLIMIRNMILMFMAIPMAANNIQPVKFTPGSMKI
jgi:hypothetical protein